ncbi:hypothetical protein Baya_16860 [Bagarius yarrelli]|uniref:Uncharacterized protein n=1 Tax=Bagarius yarrelli TaxID=175774 RepID=A0A556VWW9_BAGYA|nr:hypothetical protein Baya_16860 [Bagarius yarrelli]
MLASCIGNVFIKPTHVESKPDATFGMRTKCGAQPGAKRLFELTGQTQHVMESDSTSKRFWYDVNTHEAQDHEVRQSYREAKAACWRRLIFDGEGQCLVEKVSVRWRRSGYHKGGQCIIKEVSVWWRRSVYRGGGQCLVEEVSVSWRRSVFGGGGQCIVEERPGLTTENRLNTETRFNNREPVKQHTVKHRDPVLNTETRFNNKDPV